MRIWEDDDGSDGVKQEGRRKPRLTSIFPRHWMPTGGMVKNVIITFHLGLE